jgi:hypothetical protein
MILHDKTEKEFGYVFTTATNRSCFYCVCDYCGEEFTRCKKTIIECNKVVSKDSCGIGNCKKSKSEEVQLLKFGVTNAGATKESLEKRKKSSLEKFGVENYSSSEECKKRIQEKYGVDHLSQAKEVKEKVKATRIRNSPF